VNVTKFPAARTAEILRQALTRFHVQGDLTLKLREDGDGVFIDVQDLDFPKSDVQGARTCATFLRALADVLDTREGG
jgi:hypothetical protein